MKKPNVPAGRLERRVRPSTVSLLLMNGGFTCLKCGSDLPCDCWEKCSCGWTTEVGQPCRNADTSRCSTKVKYGKYNRKTKRYE
jgi:hypothetical protein